MISLSLSLRPPSAPDSLCAVSIRWIMSCLPTIPCSACWQAFQKYPGRIGLSYKYQLQFSFIFTKWIWKPCFCGRFSGKVHMYRCGICWGYWKHFFLVTLYILQKCGGGGGREFWSPPAPPPPWALLLTVRWSVLFCDRSQCKDKVLNISHGYNNEFKISAWQEQQLNLQQRLKALLHYAISSAPCLAMVENLALQVAEVWCWGPVILCNFLSNLSRNAPRNQKTRSVCMRPC